MNIKSLSATKAIQADCDIKATNIILQGLPPEVYALVSNHKVAKELWERIQLLMQGTSLGLTDPGSIACLVASNPMTSSLSNSSKLIPKHSISITSFTISVSTVWFTFSVFLYSTHHHQHVFQSLSSNDYQSSIHHNVYSPSSSIPQLECAPTVNQQSEFSQPDSGLIVLVFQKGDDPIDAINHMMSFLYSGDKRLLAAGTYKDIHSREQVEAINGKTKGRGRGLLFVVGYMLKQLVKIYMRRNFAFLADQGIQKDKATQGLSFTHNATIKLMVDALAEVHNHDNMNNNMLNQAMQAMPSSGTMNNKFSFEEDQIVDLRSNDTFQIQVHRSVEIEILKQTIFRTLKEKESLMQTVTLLKNDFKKEESRNIDREIALEKKIKNN
ncbi:hypothetical protein Tco_0737790 [Tanacetum coccineum]